MTRAIILAALLTLTACGAVRPAGPGHEPPSASNYNPVSGTTSSGR